MPARRNRPVEPECSPEVRGLFDKLGAGRASVDQHLVRNVVDGLHGQVPGSCSPEDLRRIFRQVDPDNSGKLMPDGSWGTAATGVLTLPQFAGAFQLLQRQFGDIPEQRLVELSHGVIAQRAERQKMRNRFLQGDSPQPKQQQQSEPPAESPKGKGAKAKRAPPPQLQPSAPASQPQKQKQQQGDEPQSPARASAAQAGRQLRERWQQEEKQAGGKFNRMDFVQMKGFSHVDEQLEKFVPPQKKTLTWRKEKGQDWEGEKIEGDGGGGGGCCGLCGGVLVCERCDGLAEDRAALAEKLARAEFEAEQALCASERHEARAADMDGELRNLRRALEQAERKLVDAGNQRGVWARKIQAMEQEVAAARSVGGPQQHSQVDQHVSTLKSQLAHVEAELRQVTQERDEMQRREYAAAASVAGPYAAADGTEAAADALGAMSQQIWVLSRALELRSREADRLRDILASLQGRLSAVAPASPQAAELLAILQDLMQGTAASAAAAESESFGEGGIVQAVARAAGATADAVAALQEHLAAAAYATAEGSTAPSTVARVAQELQHSLHNGLGLGDAPSGVAAAAASGSGDAQWALAMEQRLLQARDRELQLVGVVSAREQELSDLWERLRQAQAAIVSSAGSGMENEVKLQQAKQALQKILEVLPHSRRQAVTEALGGRFSLSPAQQPPPQPPAGGHVHLMSDDDLLSGAVSTNRPLPAGSPEPARSPLPTHGGSPSAQVAAALAAAAVPRPPGWHRLLTPPGAAAPSR